MIPLLVDRRAEMPGQPGLHALIVGVSQYPNLPEVGGAVPSDLSLGLQQLTAAARSAHDVYRWLIESEDQLALPLVTCRLLLAPSTTEMDANPELAPLASDCTLETFLKAAREWREDAAVSQDGATLFYFAGHGLEPQRGVHVMLLADVGDGIGGALHRAVTTQSLDLGLAPSEAYPSIARTQITFVDACRMPPSTAHAYDAQLATRVWDVPPVATHLPDNRVHPIFYSTSVGTESWAVPNDQTLFSKALITCLKGGAAEAAGKEWRVTVNSLPPGLEHHLKQLAHSYNAEQEAKVDGAGQNTVLVFLKAPPLVDVDLRINPEAEAGNAAVTIRDLISYEHEFGPPLTPYPYRTSLPAGLYVVATRSGDRNGTNPPQRVDPPHAEWVLDV